jgi:dipeptidyl-peptidase 4
MKFYRLVAASAVALLMVAQAPALVAQKNTTPTVADWISPAYPYEVQSARKVERLAWLAYDQGKRNVYTAAAPAFTPVRLTSFLKDDGTDLTSLRLSDDGSTVIFVRGHAANRAGWVANPNSAADGAERAIWAAKIATPGVAWRVVEGANGSLAPNGSAVTFERDGQIYWARISQVRPALARDRGEEPIVRAWGTNGAPIFSPDGRKIAFVSERTDHSFVVIYDVATRTIKYMAPDVDFDSSPAWSADSKRIAFLRRPGLPFARQGQEGSGGIGLPDGPGRRGGGQGQGRAAGQGQGRGGGRGGRGGGAGQPDQPAPVVADIPGLSRATLPGGHTLALMVADVATGEAKQIWHTTPEEPRYTNINGIRWVADDRFIFTMNVQGREGARYYAILPGTGVTSQPVLITTTEGIIEDATSAQISKDGKTIFYTTNDGDIDRRHIWAAPTDGSAPPRRVTPGDGVETYPMPLASGVRVAGFSADHARPQSVAVFQVSTGEQRVIYPRLPARYPLSQHVKPEAVTLKAADGMEFYNQLFVPADLKPGEKRPAMIFVHGGPQRQMLLGYHYRHVYHMFYAVNQWLANQGYIVMSVNYRSGVGYGSAFRQAPNRGGQGNSEYQDVLAAGQYLQRRPDVDTRRIGIWGLSYGGVLTAQALARNSDIFAAGVDFAGVHLWGSSLDPESTSFKSSAIGAIGTWKSPVLLQHGDDDRNVAFQQTTGLVQLLRAHKIPYELVVFPDDVHDSLIHSRWIYLFDRMDAFLKKYLTGN